MKQPLLTIIAVFALIFMIVPANAELEIVLDQFSPQPVEPGQDLTLSVRLENENSDMENVRLEIVPDSPIKIKNENRRIIDEGRIIKYGAVTETYLLHVDPLAASGTYEIEFRSRWFSNDMSSETNKTFKVLVRGAPQLMISNITINPGRISPKDKFDLTFWVSNEGTGMAREVQVSADMSDLPFVSLDADTKVIKRLDPGETIQLNYPIQVKDKAEISSYSIPIKMDYKDENGENISSKSLAGIRVLGKAELAISDLKIEPQNPVKGDLVTVNMRIENSGTGMAKSVKINLDAPFEGTKSAFLGKIKPDDDAPGIFTFYASKDGDIPLSASIEYEDDLGTRTVNESLNLHVYKQNENSMMAPIVVAVPVIGSIAYYLSRRKKNPSNAK
ncbi:MAG: COG1361 S-layer family protein [Candidatus Methanoperedens sp.]|nr:COG1361 S-layer family protein [Candidatus Methanoperedens sp.]